MTKYYTEEDLAAIEVQFNFFRDLLPEEWRLPYENKFYDLVYDYNFRLSNKDKIQDAATEYDVKAKKVKKKIAYHTEKNGVVGISEKEVAARIELYELRKLPASNMRVSKRYIEQFIDEIRTELQTDENLPYGRRAKALLDII